MTQLDQKIEKYKELLLKWQPKINLVSKSTLSDLDGNHFKDSSFIYPLMNPESQTLVDFGSGAGFPGMVLALLSQNDHRPLTVHLIESDLRKSVFLKEVSRICQVPVEVHCERIEKVSLKADIITARALASLNKLLEYSLPFWKEETNAFFLKGEQAEQEIKEAEKQFHFKYSLHQQDKGCIIQITELTK